MRSSDIETLNQAADFLIRYGFLGVGLALTFLIAPAVYKFWKARNLALGTACFGIAFVVAFGVLDGIQKFAPHWISGKRELIGGVVLGIGDGFGVQIKSDLRQAGQAYIKREYDIEHRNLYNFPFILVAGEVPTCLAVAVAGTDANAPEPFVFNVGPITAADRASDVQLLFKLQQDGSATKLLYWREHRQRRAGDTLAIEPLAGNASSCGGQTTHLPGGWFLSRAHAQARPATSVDDIAARLRSDDLFSRRDARIALSRQGVGAFGAISQLLDTNNYRIQLGALVALSEMPDDQRRKAPPALLEKVRRFLGHSDATMRQTAASAVR